MSRDTFSDVQAIIRCHRKYLRQRVQGSSAMFDCSKQHYHGTIGDNAQNNGAVKQIDGIQAG